MKRFGARLAAAVAERGPLCVGLDPHPSLLRDWGLPDDPYGLALAKDGKRVAVAGYGGHVAVWKCLALVGIAAVLFPAALAVYQRALDVARRRGSLGLY